MYEITVIFRDYDSNDIGFMYAVRVRNSMETLNIINRPVSLSD